MSAHPSQSETSRLAIKPGHALSAPGGGSRSDSGADSGTNPGDPETTGDWRSLYPFASHFLDLGGVRYHYLDEPLDPGAVGGCLLMVHGNPTWSFYWRNLVLAFRGRHRVVACDHVGCGLSDKPQEYAYRLEQHSQNLVTLIRQLDLREITLLVHDWGGPIGLGALLPERERFRRVVVFNTGAFPPPFCPFRIRVCRTPWLGEYGVRQWNLFARAALAMAVAKPHRMTPAVRAGFLAPYSNWQNRVAIHRFVQDIPLSRRHPTWQVLANLERQLAALQDLPVQLIWGMQDWCFTPDCLRRMWQIFPHARVHRLGDASHYVVEDAHERIVPLIRRFVNET